MKWIFLAAAVAALALAAGCGKAVPEAAQAAQTAETAQAATPASPTPISRYADNPGDSVFTVSTAEELAMLAQIVNGTWGGEPRRHSFSGKTVKLTRNVDLSAYDNWVPIGNKKDYRSNVSFKGIFDGGGYVISNLTINRPDSSYQGLFGHIYHHGSVRNLGLDSINIHGYSDVGGVAGSMDGGSVFDCYSTGTVNGHNAVGGIAGIVSRYVVFGTVANCYSTATVSGQSYVGGVVGNVNGGKLLNCYAAGAVSGTSHVGGIAGANIAEHTHGSVINCVALNPYVKGREKSGRVIGDIETEIYYYYEYGMIPGSAAYTEMKRRAAYSTVMYPREHSIISNNAASTKMKNRVGSTAWPGKIADGVKANNGSDITAAAINSDPTLGGRFKSADDWAADPNNLPGLHGKRDSWTTAPGHLPGLHGKVVEMPEHLRQRQQTKGGD